MNVIKPHLPLIALGVVVLLALGFWYQSSQESGPAPVPGAEEAATTTEETAPAAGAPAAPAASGGIGVAPAAGGVIPGLPPGAQVTGVTYWAPFTSDGWDLSFKYQTGWDVSHTKDKDGNVGQVHFASSKGTIWVGNDMPIAEPAGLDNVTAEKRTVAGRPVTVRTFPNPNATYAYYVYFSIPEGNDTYYFAIRSISDDRKFADDFIARVGAE